MASARQPPGPALGHRAGARPPWRHGDQRGGRPVRGRPLFSVALYSRPSTAAAPASVPRPKEVDSMPFDPHGWIRRSLDPGQRMGEVMFGLIMVLTFTLTAGLSVSEGPEGVRELL